MKVTYQRKLDQNYLVLEQEEFREWYQVGMLEKNKIPGFLSCRVNRIDREAMFYYEITSKQSLSLVLERKRLSAYEFCKLLKSLQRSAKVCSEYLLDTDKILLHPDYIYMDPDKWEFSFCYFPFAGNDIQEELLSLAEYLLEHLNRQDQKAVSLAYEFYRMAGEANISLERSLSEWDAEESGTASRPGEGTEAQSSGSKQMSRMAGTEKTAEEPAEKPASPKAETVILTDKPSGTLHLRSLNPAYHDMSITGESFLIGKKKDAVDGCLKARGISRIHGKISKEGESYYLTDLNSTNGTFLNGGRLEVNEKARIRPGDCIGFADVEYIVEL